MGGIEPYLLHAQQFAWKREWLEDFNIYRQKKGDPPLSDSEGDWPLVGCKELIV